MIKVIHKNLAGEKIAESNFKTQDEMDAHKLKNPEWYEPNMLTEAEDITIKVDLEKKFNSDDESDKLCLKAYKLVKFHNRKFASKESLMTLMQNQQAMWLLLFLLGGSPDLALGLIQQMDKTMYPPELIAEVTELLILAIELTKEK